MDENVTIEIEDIESLFTTYKDSYIETFELTEFHFTKMKELKINRSGCLIIVMVNSKPCGFFTISLSKSYDATWSDSTPDSSLHAGYGYFTCTGMRIYEIIVLFVLVRILRAG